MPTRTLPKPGRAVAVALTTLTTAGWDEPDALDIITDVAGTLMRRTTNGPAMDWAYQIEAIAKTRKARLP
jgi:hypothetical protein